MSRLELFLSNDVDSYFLRLVVAFTRLDDQVNSIVLSNSALALVQQGLIKLPSIPSLVTNQPGTLTNAYTIAQYLAELSSTDDILVGSDNQEIAEVLSVFELSRKLSVDDLINHYAKILEPRVFVTSRHVTFGDFYLFCRVYDKVTDFKDSDKTGKFVHFWRWFNQIQSLPGVREFLLESGRLVVPPPNPFVQPEQQQKKKKK